jgi:hypothetical protein
MAILKPGQLASGSYTISGSFSGSFQGSGAGLNNIPSSAIVGLSSTQIASGAVSASVSTGTGSFTVTSGSSTFMFVSSSGNVGLGTTTPSRLLHVSEGGTRLSQTFNPGVPTLYVYHGRTETDSTVRFENASGDQLYFGGNGLFVTGNTTIGNGSTSLSARLGVKGSGTTSATTSLLVQNSAAIPSLQLTDDGNIKFFDTNTAVASTSYASFIPKYSTNNMALGFYEGSSPGVLRLVIYRDGSNTVYLTTGGGNVFTASPSAATIPGTLNANNTLYVTGSRVGIGTTTPSSSLHVMGSVPVMSNLAQGIIFNNTLTAGSSSDILVGLDINPTFGGNSSSNWHTLRLWQPLDQYGDNRPYLSWRYGNLGGTQYDVFRMFMDSNWKVNFKSTGNTPGFIFTGGNLMINTTTDAGYRLDVNGTARVVNNFTVGNVIQNGGNANTFATIINHMGAAQSVSGFNTTRINANTDLGVGFAGAPDASAVVELRGTTKGFLPPRMTGAQAELISSPAEGLMVYATDGTGVTITSKGWWGYDGATWVKFN